MGGGAPNPDWGGITGPGVGRLVEAGVEVGGGDENSGGPVGFRAASQLLSDLPNPPGECRGCSIP